MRRAISVISVVTVLSACSGRSCALFPVEHAQRVERLAKERGIQLSVDNCRDAFEGGFQMPGRFSCLARLDAAQKQRVIDAFALTKRERALGYYTPTQTHRCETRIDLPYDRARDEAWRADVWAADQRPSSAPGFESIELHVAPSGEACIELVAIER